MLLNHLLSVTFLQMLQGDVTKSHKCSSEPKCVLFIITGCYTLHLKILKYLVVSYLFIDVEGVKNTFFVKFNSIRAHLWIYI
jgi:hypothetical protein